MTDEAKPEEAKSDAKPEEVKSEVVKPEAKPADAKPAAKPAAAYLRAVLTHARNLGLTVLPATADFGYSESILWHDPDLAEGLPVRDEPYRAQGGRLLPDDTDAPRLPNPDFETLPALGR